MIDLDSKVNAMTPAYILKLGFKVYFTNVKAQKVDGSTFDTLEMVLTNFQIEDKLTRA